MNSLRYLLLVLALASLSASLSTRGDLLGNLGLQKFEKTPDRPSPPPPSSRPISPAGATFAPDDSARLEKLRQAQAEQKRREEAERVRLAALAEKQSGLRALESKDWEHAVARLDAARRSLQSDAELDAQLAYAKQKLHEQEERHRKNREAFHPFASGGEPSLPLASPAGRASSKVDPFNPLGPAGPPPPTTPAVKRHTEETVADGFWQRQLSAEEKQSKTTVWSALTGTGVRQNASPAEYTPPVRASFHPEVAESFRRKLNIKGDLDHPITDVMFTSDPEHRSPDAYRQVVQQFDVEHSPRYQKQRDGKNTKTFCNVFARDVAHAMGAPLPSEATVNDMVTWLHKQQPQTSGQREGAWVRLDLRAAKEMANEGHPTIIIQKNPGRPIVPGGQTGEVHGHVAVLLPNGRYNTAETGPIKGEVSTAQAGARNFNWKNGGDERFKKSDEVQYWSYK